jgi:hypothetical protein
MATEAKPTQTIPKPKEVNPLDDLERDLKELIERKLQSCTSLKTTDEQKQCAEGIAEAAAKGTIALWRYLDHFPPKPPEKKEEPKKP